MQIVIHRADHSSNAPGHRLRIAGCANRHSCFRPRALPERHVNFRKVLTEIPDSNIVEDPHYLQFHGWAISRDPWDRLINCDTLGERIQTWQVMPNEGLIHHRYRNSSGGILLSKAAPFDHANPQSLKMSRRYHLE